MLPSGSSNQWSQAAIAARQRFSSGRAVSESALAPSILRSWTRCAERGLAMHAEPKVEPMSQGELRARRERHEVLRRRCRPEVEGLYADASITDSIVILTDPSGVVLDTVGSTAFADKAAKVALRPGVDWSEATIGTNAIGTALVERRPIEVRGVEHYSEPHGILSCAASPIVDPFGEMVGLLDLSGPASVAHLHALALVQLSVDQIEHRMFDGAFSGLDVLRFHSDQHFLGTVREGVLVFEDHKLVAANRHALKLLGLGWDALGGRRYGDLFEGALGRDSTVRQVRRQLGENVFMRAERPAGEASVHALRPSPASGRRAAAEAPREPAPRFDSATHSALDRAVRLIDAQVPVLIQGETGTGKEVFARQMHARSARAQRPFAAVNCAALPEGLIESELFGYEEGAFTGARRAGFKGLLREADGGVLFLDEIGDMPLSLQTRLLRVLQEREVTPLGGGRAVPVDFALICASHRNLRQLVEAGAFRADLYFRIAQYTVLLPPLRTLPERADLVRSLWGELAGADQPAALSPRCLELLAGYDWPGNFRQFVGTLRVLQALAEPGGELNEDVLPPEIRTRVAAPGTPAPGLPEGVVTDPLPPGMAAGDLGTLTRAAMQAALNASDGNVSKAARQLGIHRSTLHRYLASEGKGGLKG